MNKCNMMIKTMEKITKIIMMNKGRKIKIKMKIMMIVKPIKIISI